MSRYSPLLLIALLSSVGCDRFRTSMPQWVYLTQSAARGVEQGHGATQVSRVKVGGEDVLVCLVPDVTKGRGYSMDIIHVARANSLSLLVIRIAGLRVGGNVNATLPMQWRSVGPSTSRLPGESGKKYTSQRFAFSRELDPECDKSVAFELILEFEGNANLSERIELEPRLVTMPSAM